MNKKLFFALATTAALFASCSSDDLSVSQAPQAPAINDSELAQIQIGIKNPTASTRGTGTVGDLASEATNVWAGQTFNLFMFEKGTFTTARKTVNEQEADIFNNAELTAPNANEATGAATLILNDVVNYNYYPTTGAFDFWAYRLDDAVTGDPVGVVGAGSTATDDATEVTVPFEIDGSQDILVGVPDPAADLATLQESYPTATADQIYSAYSARRGITPTLKFSHLLTRLNFMVKAGSQKVSDAAASVGAFATYNGFKVTKVTVKSKSTGNLVAAYKEGSAYTAPQIVWTDGTQLWSDPTSLTEMELKSRGVNVATKEEGIFTPVTVTIAADGTATYGSYTVGNDQYSASASLAVYDSNATNTLTGVPTGNATTLGALVDAYLTNNAQDTDPVTYTAGTVTGYQYTQTTAYEAGNTTDAASNLVDLVEVIPHWTAGTPASYTWEAYTGTDDATLTGTEDPTTETVGTVGAIYENTTTNEKFECTAVTEATGGAAEATAVGEALLVAPADGNGYEIELTYKRWKANTATTGEEIESTITKTITRTGGAFFKAGTSYKVTITIFEDGETSTNTELEGWDEGEDFDIED